MQQRNTFQMKLTMDAVLQLANHPTADMVYDYVKEEYPNISRTTVYRNLNKLVDMGRLSRVKVSDSADRFDHHLNKHYHFVCTQCGVLSDLEAEYHRHINEMVQGLGGRQINDHWIMFDGICRECLKKAEDKK